MSDFRGGLLIAGLYVALCAAVIGAIYADYRSKQ
jgi:hypothetical protein